MAICKFLQYNMAMGRQPRLRADRLKEEVEKLPIKPGELAEELGVSYETLYKTLRGQIGQPPAETIAKIALRTGCSIEYFMDLTDKKEATNLDLTEMQYSLFGLLKALPESRQYDLLLMAKTYADNQEETTRRLFSEMQDLIFKAADEMGRGKDLDRFLKQQTKEMEDEDSQSPDEDNDEDDADGADKPTEK